MQFAVALVWPALALVFAGAFAGLWRADQSRLHLLGFSLGFFALSVLFTVIIVFPWIKDPRFVAFLHVLSCSSVIAIVWGATTRLNQRTPLAAMFGMTLISALLLYLALENDHPPVALLLQNGVSGMLFGLGAVLLWTARSTNLLDRILVWTLSLLALISLLRPLLILYLEVEIAAIVQSRVELGAAMMAILTVLSTILGIVLIAIAIQEAIEIRHNAERSDPVSGFLDQHTFEQKSEAALATAQRLNMPVTLAVLQFDWYEKILAKWGQDTSDMVVREVADVVRAWKRDSDVVGRFSEDRFAILFVGVGSASVQKIVSKLRDDMDQACNDRMSGLLKFTLSSSVSVAATGTSFKDLLRLSLTPLAQAQSLGANVSFVDGVEVPQTDLGAAQDGTFVSHG